MMADDTGAAAPDTTTTDQIDTGAPEAPVSISEAAAPAEKPATVLGSDATDKPVAAPADWPEDWRTKVAGQDAKELARLQRMGSPADVWKAYRALEAKVSAGQAKPEPLPDNATPEQIAAWRKEQGLPESPAAFVPELGNGLVLGEADKPLLEGFKDVAFKANMTPTQFNEALNWYYSQMDTMRAQQEDADVLYHKEAEDTLRQEWGGEYRMHLNSINNLTALAPEGVAERLLAGRTADGKRIGDDPGIIKWLAAVSREFNPAMPHIPAGSGNPIKATSDRIGEIEAMMTKNPREYWQNEAVQSELRDLYAAREKLNGRNAA